MGRELAWPFPHGINGSGGPHIPLTPQLGPPLLWFQECVVLSSDNSSSFPFSWVPHQNLGADIVSQAGDRELSTLSRG